MSQTANIWKPKRWAPHMGMHAPLIFLFCFFPESQSQQALEVRPPTPSSSPKEIFMSFAHTTLNFQTYRSNIETCSILSLFGKCSCQFFRILMLCSVVLVALFNPFNLRRVLPIYHILRPCYNF
jgi:hypothetical protein